MKLTNKKAKDIYKRLRSLDVRGSIDNYPEDEIDGKSDLEILAEEISWYRSSFEEDGCCLCEDLESARKLLRETKNGKRIHLDPITLKPERAYRPFEIQSAKDVIAEYKQLVYYGKKLADLGYCGRY